MNSLVFIDGGISNLDEMIKALPSEAKYFVLDSNVNSLIQLSEICARFREIDAIHIISHGESGGVNLGNVVLDSESIAGYNKELEKIGMALSPSGDIFIYGCNVAYGNVGRDFVYRLSNLTQADVAASVDQSGGDSGNWILESIVGEVNSESFNLETYPGVLAIGLGSAGADTITGTASVDVLTGFAGDDLLIGAEGNDLLIGSSGADSVQYSSIYANYTIKKSAPGVYSIVSGGVATDGVDALIGIEKINFSDVSVIINSNGSPANYQVNTTTTRDQTNPTAVLRYDSLGNQAGWMILWESQDGLSNYNYPEDIKAKKYSITGEVSGVEVKINADYTSGLNTHQTSAQKDVAAATAGNGSTLIAWTSDQQDGSSNGVYARVMSSAGALASEFRVNTNGFASQQDASVAAIGNNSWIIVWADNGINSTNYQGIRFKTYINNTLSSEYSVASYINPGNHAPKATALSDGGWLISWSDGANLLGSTYSSSGAQGSLFVIGSSSWSMGGGMLQRCQQEVGLQLGMTEVTDRFMLKNLTGQTLQAYQLP